MAPESPVATVPATTDDNSGTISAAAAEIQHSDLWTNASLVDADRSGDGRQAAAAGEEHYTSDLLRRRAIRLPRAELMMLSANPERDRRAREAMLIILTLLLALVMPILLWLSAGETPLLVWRLSLLLSTYFFLCANMLFVTKCFCAVVVDFYFGALLAYFADHVFGPRIGTVTIYLSSIFTAAFAGYALAERRRSDGTERSADNVPAFAGEEEEEYARAVLISSAAVISMTLLVPTAYVAWLILWPHANTDDGYRVEDILRDLSYTILAYLFLLDDFGHASPTARSSSWGRRELSHFPHRVRRHHRFTLYFRCHFRRCCWDRRDLAWYYSPHRLVWILRGSLLLLQSESEDEEQPTCGATA